MHLFTYDKHYKEEWWGDSTLYTIQHSTGVIHEALGLGGSPCITLTSTRTRTTVELPPSKNPFREGNNLWPSGPV